MDLREILYLTLLLLMAGLSLVQTIRQSQSWKVMHKIDKKMAMFGVWRKNTDQKIEKNEKLIKDHEVRISSLEKNEVGAVNREIYGKK